MLKTCKDEVESSTFERVPSLELDILSRKLIFEIIETTPVV